MPAAATLSLSVSGEDLPALFKSLLAEPLFASGEPIRIDDDEPPKRSIDDYVAASQSSVGVDFSGDRHVGFQLGAVVKGIRPDWTPDVAELLGILGRVPCTLATVYGLNRDWYKGDKSLKPPMAGFGQSHYMFGSFAAFKGAGHERLVSRRWLEHGPWLLHRGEGDVSLLQFHDLDADAATSSAQARRAIARLGPSDTGGIYPRDFEMETTFDLQYSGRDHRAAVVVAKREVAPREMLDATSLRGSAVIGADAPIDHVAFVYLDEAQARRDLPELWLRGLECWTYIDGVETRIDADYAAPPPIKPW